MVCVRIARRQTRGGSGSKSPMGGAAVADERVGIDVGSGIGVGSGIDVGVVDD